MRILHGFSFLHRTFYMPFNEKETPLKGTKMTQYQRDNQRLLLEWETKFAAILVCAELNTPNLKK